MSFYPERDAQVTLKYSVERFVLTLVQQNCLPIKYHPFSSSFFTNSPGNENKQTNTREKGGQIETRVWEYYGRGRVAVKRGLGGAVPRTGNALCS